MIDAAAFAGMFIGKLTDPLSYVLIALVVAVLSAGWGLRGVVGVVLGVTAVWLGVLWPWWQELGVAGQWRFHAALGLSQHGLIAAIAWGGFVLMQRIKRRGGGAGHR